MDRTPLSEERLDEFREALLVRRREAMGDLEGVRREEGASGGMEARMPTHPADEATDQQARDISEQLDQAERDLVVEIDEALRRMEDGTYGLCEECGGPIAVERLRAMPWARLCIKHA